MNKATDAPTPVRWPLEREPRRVPFFRGRAKEHNSRLHDHDFCAATRPDDRDISNVSYRRNAGVAEAADDDGVVPLLYPFWNGTKKFRHHQRRVGVRLDRRRSVFERPDVNGNIG